MEREHFKYKFDLVDKWKFLSCVCCTLLEELQLGFI